MSGRGWHRLALGLVLASYLIAFLIGHDASERAFYPAHFDQMAYRAAAANLEHTTRGQGPIEVIGTLLEHSTAQGFVHLAIGALAYRLGLEPDLLVFLGFVLALWLIWHVFAKACGDSWLGWAAVALVCLPETTMRYVGAFTDFRPDILAFVLWTLASALVLTADGLAKRSRAIGIGFVFGILFCTRTLALTYAAVALPLIVFAVWVTAGPASPARRARLANLALCMLVAAVLAAPFFITQHEKMWDYYVENHISARENEARAFSGGFGDHLRFYWKNLRHDHLGGAGLLAPILLCGLLAWRHRRDLAHIWPLLLQWLAFLSPLLVLSSGPQYSIVVVGIVAGNFTLLGLVPAVAVRADRPLPRLLIPLIVLGLAAWPARFLAARFAERDTRLAAGHDQVPGILAAIVDHSLARPSVLVSTIPMIESIAALMLDLTEYRRTGGFPNRYVAGLGHQIYACGSEYEYRNVLEASDVVVHWDGGQSGGSELPANREALQRRPLIDEVLASCFEPAPGIDPVLLGGHPLRVYFRKP